jgi:hypothetical protein
MGKPDMSLAGERFGKLLVIARVPQGIYRNGRAYWNVRCDCGTEKVVAGIRLKNGHTKSCGCVQREQMDHSKRLIDLSGQTFGYLTVLGRDISQKWVKAHWLCRCVCGEIASVSKTNLRIGGTKSCGCKTKELISAANGNRLLDRRFGRLLVIKQMPSRHGHTRWLCRCDCGHEVALLSNQLRDKSGLTDCGCIARRVGAEQRQYPVGRQYGAWTVLAYVGREYGQLLYQCRCPCGEQREVCLGNLKQGLSTNCGCVRKQANTARLLVDLTGRGFGKLRVIERAPNNAHKHTMWACQCECGNRVVVGGQSLKMGRTTTCGCGKFRQASARNKVLCRYRTSAAHRRIPWMLSPGEAFAIMATACRYCGEQPQNVSETPSGRFVWNGIDRRNNQAGYSVENCVACCSLCNRLKSTMSAEEFLAWIARIQSYQAELLQRSALS